MCLDITGLKGDGFAELGLGFLELLLPGQSDPAVVVRPGIIVPAGSISGDQQHGEYQQK
jgi:hypothetical protein